MTEDEHNMQARRVPVEEVTTINIPEIPFGGKHMIDKELSEYELKLLKSFRSFPAWISVKDRLPEHKQRCLIFDTNMHCSIDNTPKTIIQIYTATFFQGEHRPNGPWRSYDTGFGNNQFPWDWKEGNRKWFSQDVTHWMELPEAPEVEG